MDGGEDNDDDAEGDEDEDDEPTESAIEKEEPTIPSKVKSGPIAENVPHDRIVHVNKLPKRKFISRDTCKFDGQKHCVEISA